MEINIETFETAGPKTLKLLSVGHLPRTDNVARSTLCESVCSKTAFLPDAVISVGAQQKDEIWIMTNYKGQV
jgi:DNA-binding transcriptional regulator/RsmH inhibitor MraZ